MLANGRGAVVFFFVLSGFVLSGSLARGPVQLGPAAVQFGLSRLFRIYPAVVSTILIFWILYATTGLRLHPTLSYEPWAVMKTILLLDVRLDGVMWSLQTELIAAPLIFLSVVSASRLGAWSVALVTLALAACSLSDAWNTQLVLPGGPSRVVYLYSFIAGVLTYQLGAQFWRLAALRTTMVQFAMLAVSLVMIFGAHVAMDWTWRVPLVETAASALIVGLLAFGSLGRVQRFLSHPVLRFYGRISYSFYILHPLSLTIIWFIPHELETLIHAGVPPAVVNWTLGIASVLVVTLLAVLSYRYVEKPGIAMGHLLCARLANARARAGAANAALS